MTVRISGLKRLLAGTACGIAIVAAAPAFAAEPAPAPAQQDTAAAPVAASTDVAPQDIVVTAQRRAERLQDVPISIANFSTQTLRNANVQSLSEIDKLTSGIRFDKRTNFVVPTIRGITTNVVLAGGGSNVGVYLDGFYSPSLQGSDIQLLNVESVQVLKGPQGTLFGRNTTGGAVLVNTTEPNQNTRVVAEIGYGSYNAVRYQGYVNVGIASWLAADVGASYTMGDGYITNIANGYDRMGRYRNFSMRAGLKATFGNLSLVARYAHSDLNDPTNLLQVPYIFNGKVAAQFAYLPGAIVATQRGTVSADEDFVYHFKSDAYQFKGTLDLAPFTITSYTQWRNDKQLEHKYSLDYTNLPGAALDIHDYNTTFTQELLVTSKPGSPLQYTVGAFYFNAAQAFPSVLSRAGTAPTFTEITFSSVRNKSIAGYADVTYNIAGGLFLTGGLRYTHDEVDDATWKGITVATGGTPASGGKFLPVLSTSRFTPRAVIRYEFDRATNVYASFSKGYKAAIYNVGGLDSAPILPEELTAYEVGLKHSDSALTANLSFWYYDYTNQQIVAGVLKNGIPVSKITNAASSTMYGVDGDFSYRVMPDFTLTAGFEWAHNRYDQFPNAPHVTQTAANAFVTDFNGSANGLPMLRSPDFTANVGASYGTALAGGHLILSGNLYYTSKFYFDAANQFPQDAYALLGLNAQWTDPSDHYTLAVSAKNVTNTKYYAQVASNTLGIGAVWGAPPMIEGSLRVKF
jgi:iron complex outermembrane receptor protein